MESNFERKYKCPCCGYLTLKEEPNNTFQLCEVCYWEDDGIQLSFPDFEGGANIVSLNTAKENFKKFGAIEIQFIEYVRKPFHNE